jgi:hypothetical protein
MRRGTPSRAGAAFAATVAIALAAPTAAIAEPFIGSIKSFKSTPVIQPVATCAGCGPAFDLELEYVLEGEGYGATASNPKGGIPPLSGVNLFLPAGVQVHPAGFAQCTEATLKNVGPSGCPAGSELSNVGEAQDDVTFGTSRAPEEATLQAFGSAGGLLIFEHGSSPVNVEAIWNGQFASSHAPPYEEELIGVLPAVVDVPGAPLRSIRSFRLLLGASGVSGPYLTLPSTCPVGALPFKTEVTFGGEHVGEREFQIPAQTRTATLLVPCPPGLPLPPVEPPPPPRPTAAQIAGLLGTELVPSGKGAKIGALLRHGGFTRLLRALEAGSLSIGWYHVPRGASLARRRPKPLLVASAAATYTAAGSERITIRLTRRGRQLLRHARRLALSAKGSFTPAGEPAVVAIRKFTLKR